jgi:hypothetical protein
MSCGIDCNGYKLYSNTYFTPLTFFWELSLPPLKFVGSSFTIFVYDGPAPLVCPLSSSSYEVFGSKVKTRGSY